MIILITLISFVLKKKSPTSEYSTGSQDENYVIALVGKPTVGKSTILRAGLNDLTPITNVGAEKGNIFFYILC